MFNATVIQNSNIHNLLLSRMMDYISKSNDLEIFNLLKTLESWHLYSKTETEKSFCREWYTRIALLILKTGKRSV